MKILSLFLFVLCFVCNTQAQNFASPSFTINGLTFLCKQETHTSVIFNQSNLSQNHAMESYPRANCYMAYVDYAKIRTVLHTVFNADRRATFKTIDAGMNISIFIDPMSGEIKELMYFVSKITPFTQQEIYQLEQGLKGLVMPAKPWCAPMKWVVFPLTVMWE